MIYRYRVKSYSLQGDLSLITQNAVALVQRRQGVAAQRPREEEQKRNQNEDSNEKASEQKETIQHKEENRVLEQEQEEQAKMIK